MSRLIALRHAPTAWNEAGRIQGHSDIALSPAGRALAAGWRLPDYAAGWPVATSPLRRARETAELMGLAGRPDPTLIEMYWGHWEGLTREDLIDRPGFIENTRRGADFRPDGGESPREVMARLEPFVAGLRRDSVAVAHKGVLRALMALATGWEFLGKPPARLSQGMALLFEVDDALRLTGTVALS